MVSNICTTGMRNSKWHTSATSNQQLTSSIYKMDVWYQRFLCSVPWTEAVCSLHRCVFAIFEVVSVQRVFFPAVCLAQSYHWCLVCASYPRDRCLVCASDIPRRCLVCGPYRPLSLVSLGGTSSIRLLLFCRIVRYDRFPAPLSIESTSLPIRCW